MFADSKTKCKFATFNEFVMKDKMDREERTDMEDDVEFEGWEPWD